MKKNLNIGIIGAGSIFTPELVQLLISRSLIYDNLVLKFMDIDEERLKIVSGLCEKMIAKNSSRIKIEFVDNYHDTIVDADFLLIQFRVGGADARIKDELLGKKYKIPFVETVSVCGIATYLRTYYEIEKISTIIKEKNPNTWVMNFSNPAGIISESLYKLGVKNVVGVCNASTNFLTKLCEKLQITDKQQIFMSWRGLNHLTIIDKLLLDGEPILETLIDNLQDFENETIPFSQYMLKQLKFIPNQYFQYYLRRNEMTDKLQKMEEVRSQVVKKIDSDLVNSYKTVDQIPDSLSKRGGSGYSKTVVDLICSLILGDNKIHYLVTKNNSSIPELDYDDYVEVPTVVSANQILPLACGSLPLVAQSLVLSMKNSDKLLFSAAQSRDKSILYNAILAHPLIASEGIASHLQEDILQENKKWLPSELH